MKAAKGRDQRVVTSKTTLLSQNQNHRSDIPPKVSNLLPVLLLPSSLTHIISKDNNKLLTKKQLKQDLKDFELIPHFHYAKIITTGPGQYDVTFKSYLPYIIFGTITLFLLATIIYLLTLIN